MGPRHDGNSDQCDAASKVEPSTHPLCAAASLDADTMVASERHKYAEICPDAYQLHYIEAAPACNEALRSKA